MKKEQVYVVIDSEKVAKKTAKVLAMFDEKLSSELLFKFCLQNNGWLHISKNSLKKHWVWSMPNSHFTINDTKVYVSELKQILAKDHLKKGDVIVCNLGGEKWIVEFSNFTPVEPFQLVGFKWNYKGETHISVRGGYFDKFIRYATEEEKQLLNPPVVKDNPKSKIEIFHNGNYKEVRCLSFAVDFTKDFKELTTDDYIGKWIVVDCKHYKSPTAKDAVVFYDGKDESFGFDYEGDFCDNFNISNNLDNIKRLATPEEVAMIFYQEKEKRYPNHKGFSFNHTTNEINCVGGIVFKNGTWLEAKKIEIDPFKELKEAHKKGFEIEYKSSSGQWKTSSNPAWRKTGNYRIRPVKIGDWFFTTHEQTNVKYYYQVNCSNIDDVKPNHVRVLNQMVIDILNNGKYTV